MPQETKKLPLKGFFFHEPFIQNYWADILDEVYRKQVYLPFLPTEKKGSVCFDIGANVGLTTYYFSQYFETIHSFEPSTQHIEALEKMIETNELTNVYPHKTALSNKNGITKFYHNDNQTMFSLESSVNKQDDFEEVPTMDLSSAMEELAIDHIDLLKLDVEGHEGQIVNSEGFKNVALKIKVICGEYHDWASCSQPNFQRALEELGFDFKWRHDTKAKVFEAIRL